MKMYLCPRCHKDHGPEQIYGISAEYCSQCNDEMKGYTLQDLYTSSRALNIAAYMPYIPFYQTALPESSSI